jgi:hypothetical protein
VHEYKLADGKEFEFVGSVLYQLERAKNGPSKAVAKWAQDTLGVLVGLGYVDSLVFWSVRDTKTSTLEPEHYATKDLALARRRELGGNSARYRVESYPRGTVPE